LRKILRTFVFEKNIVDPPSPTFSGKHFCFPEKIFLGGPEMEGAQILDNTPPQSETGWHGPGQNIQNSSVYTRKSLTS
jgi:hypothetical protein